MVPVAPSNEADRVAPVALTFDVEPLVTVAVAVGPPEVPPPDGVQLATLKEKLCTRNEAFPVGFSSFITTLSVNVLLNVRV